MFAVLLLICSLARAEEAWLTLSGAGPLPWGTADQPLDAVPRARDLYLPDTGFIGMSTRDKPDDLEIPSIDGERHFLRYVGGQLVDAWVLKQGAIPISEFSRLGDLEFEGAVLGPALDSPGWRAVGDARSWRFQGRTVLIWKDRSSNVEIVASRAVSMGGYGVRRDSALVPGIASRFKPAIKGEMNRWVKPRALELSGCLDNAPKPVEATVNLRWDGQGRVSRIQVTADQPAADLMECVAGSIADLTALPNQEGSFSVLRLR